MPTLVLLIALSVQNPPDELKVSADTQERVDGVVQASGNVVVNYQDIEVRADWIRYDEATQVLTAGDHIVFSRLSENLEGDKAEIRMATKSGWITNASGMIAPGFHVTAGKATRRENGEYEVENARVTSCQPGEPAWEIRLARGVVRPDEGFVARNTVLRFQNIPIMYLPYIGAPASSKSRASGFLIPATSTSTTKGRSIRESYYWAINRSADLLVTGEYFTERGPAGLFEFRAVPNASSRIEFTSFLAKDRQGQGGQSSQLLAYGTFGRGFRGVADLNLVSSILFRQVYEEGFDVITSPVEQSMAFISHNRDDASYNIQYNRTATFFTDQPAAVLRKFPAIDVSLNSMRLGRLPVYFRLDGGWTAFSRRDTALKTPSFLQRLDLHPVLDVPVLQTPAFSWTHHLGLRETVYTHRRQPQLMRDALNRLSVEYGFSFAGPRIERSFGPWRHSVEATADYRYVSGADDYERTILLDEAELFTNTNEIEYGITQRLFRNREVFSWRVAQKYFVDPEFGGLLRDGRRNILAPLLDLTGFAFADGKRRFSPVVSSVRFSPTPSTSTDLQVNYDTLRSQFRSAGIIGGLNRGPVFANAAYFFTRRTEIQFPSNQLRGTVGFGNIERRGFNAATNFALDIERKRIQSSTTQLSYNADCYGMSLEFLQFNLGARRESRIRFSFSLKNLGSFGTLRKQERLF